MSGSSYPWVASFILSLALGGLCPAAEISVQPGQSALAQAIKQAAAGDTVVLQPGVYREWVRIDKPLTLRGLPGALLEGAQELKVQWSPAGADLPDVYTAPMPKRLRGLLVNGQFIAEMHFDRADEKGDWHWRTLLAKGTPLSAFKQIRALWVYHPKEQRIYARFENGAAPSALRLSALYSSEPLLTIAEAAGVMIDDLSFAHGFTAIEITDGASGAVVRQCTVASYEKTGIELTGGATRCTVEKCEITRGALEEWQPALPGNKANYEIWRIHKDVGNYDRVGIQLFRAGSGNRILSNKLDRVFDGICVGDHEIESLDKPLKSPEHGRATEIADNLIENTRDSGIELGTACIDVHVHHNTLRQTHGGLRFKLPRTGPVFIHHNRLIDGAPFGIWFSMDASPAEGYVYHNTIVGSEGRAALEYSSFNASRSSATPRWHFLNNLAATKGGFFKQSRNTPAPDFIASHNVVLGKGAPWPGDATRDQGSRYGVSLTLDAEGKPAAGSTAIDAGLDLSTYFHGRPLPGCEPGTFAGKAPDAGADELPAR